MNLEKSIVEKLLNAKTEFQFVQILLREKVLIEDWKNEPTLRERFEYLRKNAGISRRHVRNDGIHRQKYQISGSRTKS